MSERLAFLADVVRTVIPYPMHGQLIAMHPHMYVVWLSGQHYTDPLDAPEPVPGQHWMGLQLQPRKVRGRWWHGQIRGPWRDVVGCVPDPLLDLVVKKIDLPLKDS